MVKADTSQLDIFKKSLSVHILQTFNDCTFANNMFLVGGGGGFI